MNRLPLEICNIIDDYVNDLEELDQKKLMAKEISNDVLNYFFQKKLDYYFKDDGPFSIILNVIILLVLNYYTKNCEKI